RISAMAFAIGVFPAEALFFDPCRGGFRANVCGTGGAVGFSKAVSAGDKGYGFFVVHRHTPERFADVTRSCQRIGLSVRAFRVNINKSHLNCGQGVLQLTVARVALVVKPFGLRAPVHILFGFPEIFPSSGEAESLEAHGFQCAVSGENHQVGPRDFTSVFLLDGPKQQAGLVKGCVIRPAVQWRKALCSSVGSAATVSYTVSSGAVPCHSNEEWTVMPVVGWPPGLRRGHQLEEVGFDGFQVKRLEFLGVVEVLTHRVGEFGVLPQQTKAKLVGPPVAIAGSPASRLLEGASVKGAFSG